MDSQNLKGPQDYHKFYHTSTEGLIWLDGRGNPIPISHTLGTHIEAVDQNDLWNSIWTRNKVHTHAVPAHRSGPSNSTTINSNTHPMITPTGPIMKHHVEMNQSEGSTMEMVIGRPKDSAQHDAIHIKCCYLPLPILS